MHKKKTPIIVGAAQIIQQKHAALPFDPLNLIVKAGQSAFDMPGINGWQTVIDTIYMSTFLAGYMMMLQVNLVIYLVSNPTKNLLLP